MYLTILYREGDFQPLNRVQIVEHYIQQLLRRPSDVYSDVFNNKNKIDVVSAFVYALHNRKKTSFTEADWRGFCSSYKASALIAFDDRALLFELLRARIVIQSNTDIHFKYRLFYSYFLGFYVANRPAVLADFIKEEAYLSAEGAVEVIAGTSTDSSALVTELIEKVERCIGEFNNAYALENRDPFNRLEWPVHQEEQERLWKPLAERLSAGPATPQELDKLKTSLLAEKRTEDQIIVLRTFDEMERRLIAYHYALVSALQNTDLVDGELKKRAVKCALDAYFAIYQVGMIYAPLIAKHKVYVWHGVVFVNQIEFAPSDAPDEDLKRAFWVMMGAANAVAETGANSVGLRKLGEVFRALAEGEVGFRAFFNYTCVLRSKSPTWSDTAERIILNADRKSFYLREMLNSTFRQFNEQVNSGQDRDRLKRLVASIRAKRELRKDTPGSKAITRVLDRLGKAQAFAPRKAPGSET